MGGNLPSYLKPLDCSTPDERLMPYRQNENMGMAHFGS